MKTEESQIKSLRKAVEAVFGSIPVTPTDFELLSADIRHRTTRIISASTLKRIWGYVSSNTSPSYSTLSLLSKYTGNGEWYSFVRHYEGTPPLPIGSGFYDNGVIAIDSVMPGTRLRLEWGSSKTVELEKMNVPFQFIVRSAHNVKLLKDDVLEIRGLAVGRPFFAENCRRRDANLGAYSGALQSGISKIERLPTTN